MISMPSTIALRPATPSKRVAPLPRVAPLLARARRFPLDSPAEQSKATDDMGGGGGGSVGDAGNSTGYYYSAVSKQVVGNPNCR